MSDIIDEIRGLTSRRRRRSILRPACAPIRSSKGIGSSGCGRAIRRSPIPRHARFPLERRRRMEGRGRHVLQPQMRLAARRRQSDGPDPRDLRPFRQHRPRRDPRHAVRRHPRRPHRDDDALDDRHRAAAVLGAGSSASRARSIAGRSSPSRRRRWWSATSASRRREPAPRRATARRASTAPFSPRSRRRRRRAATISGISSAPSAPTTMS